MKKVVFVNQSSGYLMIDIVNVYAGNYDKVALIYGTNNVMERPLNESVSIHRIVPYNRNSTVGRIWSWMSGSLQVFFLLFFRFRDYEVIYVTNPPLAYISSLFLKNPYSVIVYDAYPDALQNIGVGKNSFIYRAWARLNKRLFPKAKNIFTLSESMAGQLSEYINRDKIKVIPNWPGSENIKPVVKENNRFIIQHNLTNRFVVLYSGNIGYTHNVEILLEVAKIMVDRSEVIFVFVGEGAKKQELIKQTTDSGLKNCLFLTWQTTEMLPFSLASADLGVVTLNSTSGMVSVPSKTYNLMAAGVPLLSIAPAKSELALLIDKYGNGRNFPLPQAQEIADFIISCINDHNILSEMSERSLVASRDFHYSNAGMYI